MGAKELAILVVPSGWIRNRRMIMAHEMPTIVELVISGFTTRKP